MLSTVVLAILGLMVLGIWTADVYGIDDIPVDSAISINISGKQILVDKSIVSNDNLIIYGIVNLFDFGEFSRKNKDFIGKKDTRK